MPRHFLQSAAKAGMPGHAVSEIMELLYIQMPLAIDTVCDALHRLQPGKAEVEQQIDALHLGCFRVCV